MSYTPNTWQDRQGAGLNRFQDQNGNLYEFTAVPTEITQAGTPFSASWMNHIEQGIAESIPSDEKAAASGVATLNASGKLVQMPTAADVGAIPSSQKGAASGVATLGANGKLVQMPTASDVGALDESIIQSGTWTPVIYGASAEGSCTYTQQWGEYYKIGKMCYVSFRIGFNSPAGMSGTLGIKGFPFPVGIAPDSGAARGPTLAYSRINVDGAVLYLHLYKNASNAQLMRAYSGSFDSVDSSALSSTGAMYLYASFVYVTT